MFNAETVSRSRTKDALRRAVPQSWKNAVAAIICSRPVGVVFEAEIIEKRLLPIFQASHHGLFPPRLFFRGNHRSPIKTMIFDTSTQVLRAVTALFSAGLYRQNSRLSTIPLTSHLVNGLPFPKDMIETFLPCGLAYGRVSTYGQTLLRAVVIFIDK